MSKIGKQPIEITQGVEVKVDGSNIVVKGPKGQLSKKTPREIKVEIKDSQILVEPLSGDHKAGALWGTMRALIFNMVKGVSEGYEKKLIIEGVGFKASVQGNKIVLNLGFSHPVEVEAPEGISFDVVKNVVTVSGIDKELVGQVTAEIRSKKKPEPYKGKGIRYENEVVRRKAGKKAATTA